MLDRRTFLGGSALFGLGLSQIAIAKAAGASLSFGDDAKEYQEEIMLWPGNPPGNGKVIGEEIIGGEGSGFGAVYNISTPRMRVYRPDSPNGRAIIIMGGGGYFRIQLWKESTPLAKWLRAKGYTVFELIYRLPNDGWDAACPFMDAQRAMRIVRMKAAQYQVNPDAIGVMGFSAGGHLAGMTAVRPDHPYYSGNDAAEKFSARPDFAALLFPVISLLPPLDTTRTKREIIGKKPTVENAKLWSVDSHISENTPPIFMVQAVDDPIAPPEHCLKMFQGMRDKGQPVEMHMFEKGGHGFGLGGANELVSQWPELFHGWLDYRNTPRKK